MKHQVTTADILHDEIYTGLGLETSMQIEKEGMPLLVGDQEDTLLRLCALNLVIFDDKLLLQYLNSIELPGGLGLR